MVRVQDLFRKYYAICFGPARSMHNPATSEPNTVTIDFRWIRDSEAIHSEFCKIEAIHLQNAIETSLFDGKVYVIPLQY
jgi:hypothetical protein